MSKLEIHRVKWPRRLAFMTRARQIMPSLMSTDATMHLRSTSGAFLPSPSQSSSPFSEAQMKPVCGWRTSHTLSRVGLRMASISVPNARVHMQLAKVVEGLAIVQDPVNGPQYQLKALIQNYECVLMGFSTRSVEVDLKSFSKRGGTSRRLKKQYALSSTLSDLHGLGVVHRNLTPSCLGIHSIERGELVLRIFDWQMSTSDADTVFTLQRTDTASRQNGGGKAACATIPEPSAPSHSRLQFPLLLEGPRKLISMRDCPPTQVEVELRFLDND